MSRRDLYPRALMVPYRKGERRTMIDLLITQWQRFLMPRGAGHCLFRRSHRRNCTCHKGEEHKSIDAKGYLVSPPFIDSHFHMDATLSLGIPRLNMSGTLLRVLACGVNLNPCSPMKPSLSGRCAIAISQCQKPWVQSAPMSTSVMTGCFAWKPARSEKKDCAL